MNMKVHILLAMQEVFETWDEKLSLLKEEQVTKTLGNSDWTIKDTVAHLWAWQQRTLARVEAAVEDREPMMPAWVIAVNFSQMDGDAINAWIFESNRDKPWNEIYQNWKNVFQNLLDTAAKVNERDMLDAERYAWLKDYSLAHFLLSSYDHHVEHNEMLEEALLT
ncbi:ClbS/DfsB family four-helix bundle protein [bacterium]|nr:ClbS/DfsB family four-helix bundle protein [bacterium]